MTGETGAIPVADSLLHKALPKSRVGRIALPASGDGLRSKELVMALLNTIGFDAVDAGPLSESWCYPPGTPAYCRDPTSQQLTILLRRAKRDKAPANRDQAARIMAKLPPDFSPQELVRVARLSAGLDTFRPRSSDCRVASWVRHSAGCIVCCLASRAVFLLGWAGAGDEDVDESSSALLPITA